MTALDVISQHFGSFADSSTRGENPGELLALIHHHEASKHQKIIRVNWRSFVVEVWTLIRFIRSLPAVALTRRWVIRGFPKKSKTSASHRAGFPAVHQ
jgi:hypothetical protein